MKLSECDIENIISIFNKSQMISIFGAGLLGGELYPVLKHFGIFDNFIDNDSVKQENGFEGERVISLDEYLTMNCKSIIVVECSPENNRAICNQLEQCDLHKNQNYFERDIFENSVLLAIMYHCYHLSYMRLAQISLTERCTLKCKKCAHGCYAVNNKAEDLTLKQVYESVDYFFSRVDYIKEFVLIGGEPFLYKHLLEVIDYIGRKYREKMNIFSITTNGTIIPALEILNKCRQYKVYIRISNYTKAIPQLNHKKLLEKLEENQNGYELQSPDLVWLDYGFEYLNRGGEKKVLKSIFEECSTPCREVRNNRLYFCVMARSISENLGYNVGKNESLDLKHMGVDYKKELLDFNLGKIKKGYLDMCNYCYGADASKHLIPVAEQLKL